MKTIVIIAETKAWQKAQSSGQYTQSTIDSTLEEIGFIHCTSPEQTIATAIRKFADRDEDLLLLLIDTDKLKSPLKYEAPPSGSPGVYPHIYGPLNVDAVYEVVPLGKDLISGTYAEPEALMLAMESIACSIVIGPEPNLSRRTIELSRKLKQGHETLFTLQDGVYHPHVSLYMLQLKVADLTKAEVLLHDIAVKTPRLDLVSTKYCQAQAYIDVEYERTKQLKDLQITVVNAFNPIRDGMRAKDKARMLESTGEARENLEKYGWRSVGQSYRPHLTLTRFANEKPIDVSNLPSFSDFSGGYQSMGLYRMGDNGTCARLISKIDLEGAA